MDRISGQDEAEIIVWNQFYNETRPIPETRWIYQTDLNCKNVDGQYIGFISGWTNECVGGLSYTNLIVVALPDYYKISQTAFAHELLHAHLVYEYHVSDPYHKRPEWGTLLNETLAFLTQEGL